jgi:hypothetical protein
MSKELYRQFGLRWAEELLCEKGVYLKRWVIETPLFSIRLHHWLHSDDTRSFHDHPWNFYSFIFRGAYTDVSPDPVLNLSNHLEGKLVFDRLSAPAFTYRRANHKHYVRVDEGGCWSILVTSPKIRRWGFWLRDKFVISYRYFYRFSNHTCD